MTHEFSHFKDVTLTCNVNKVILNSYPSIFNFKNVANVCNVSEIMADQ